MYDIEKVSRKELEEKYENLDNKLIVIQGKTLKLECVVKGKDKLIEALEKKRDQSNDYIEVLERKREENSDYIEVLEKEKKESNDHIGVLRKNIELVEELEKEGREKDVEMENAERRVKKLEKEKHKLKEIITEKDRMEESFIEATEELHKKAEELKDSYEELKEKYKQLKAEMKKERSSKNFWERRGSPIARPRQSKSVVYESGILEDDEAPGKADRKKKIVTGSRSKLILPPIEHGNLIERSNPTRTVQSPITPMPAIPTQQMKSAYRPLPSQLVEETKIPVPNYDAGLFDKPRYQPRPPQLLGSSKLPVPQYALPTPPKDKKVKRTRKYRGKIERREMSGQGDTTPRSADESKPSVWFVDA